MLRILTQVSLRSVRERSISVGEQVVRFRRLSARDHQYFAIEWLMLPLDVRQIGDLIAHFGEHQSGPTCVRNVKSSALDITFKHLGGSTYPPMFEYRLAKRRLRCKINKSQVCC